jgi:hypothetical protein
VAAFGEFTTAEVARGATSTPMAVLSGQMPKPSSRAGSNLGPLKWIKPHLTRLVEETPNGNDWRRTGLDCPIFREPANLA